MEVDALVRGDKKNSTNLLGYMPKSYLWWRTNTAHDSEVIVSIVVGSGGSIMWGCLCAAASFFGNMEEPG